VMERNPNYWNKGLPYLDGIEFYHVLPFSPEMGGSAQRTSPRAQGLRLREVLPMPMYSRS
jgi:hypothetical protein